MAAWDDRQGMGGMEVSTLSRGLLGRGYLVVCTLVVVVLVIAGTVAASLAWARQAGANFAMDAEVQAAAEVAQLEGDVSSQAVAATPRSCALEVPALLQLPELPTGCESVALTNILRFYGFDVEKTEIADKWLATSDNDFVHAFLGSPYDENGHACMAPAIVDAANAYLQARGAQVVATDATGMAFSDVLSTVAAGTPVLVWCTIDLAEPGDPYRIAYENGLEYRLLSPSHCVVISGYDMDAGTVLVSDSLAGQTSYSLETFAMRYYQIGSQAVVIS